MYAVRLRIAIDDGVVRSVDRTAGYFQDPSTYTNLVFGTLIVAYLMWLPGRIGRIFATLEANRVIVPRAEEDRPTHEKTYAAYKEEVAADLTRWWWSPLSILISLVCTVFLVLPTYVSKDPPAWFTVSPRAVFWACLWVFVGFWAIIRGAFYLSTTMLSLHRMQGRFKFRIHPLHPDGAGGLAPLGEMTQIVTYLIGIVGLILFSTLVTRCIEGGAFRFAWCNVKDVAAGAAGYVLLSPLAFFGPLLEIHKTMQKAKSELLDRIAGRIGERFEAARRALDAPTTEDSRLGPELQALRDLHGFHSMTSGSPVWPFNMGILSRFAASYLAPIVTSVIAYMLTVLLEQ